MSIRKFLFGFISLTFLGTAFSADELKERAIGFCGAVDYVSPDLDLRGGSVGSSGLDPWTVAKNYFWLYEKKEVDVPPISNAELVVPPKHGKVVYTRLSDGLSYPMYLADTGYVGDDKIVFKVNVDGKVVRVVLLLKVTDKGADSPGVHDLLCKKTGDFWKISHHKPDSLLGDYAQPINIKEEHRGSGLTFDI